MILQTIVGAVLLFSAPCPAYPTPGPDGCAYVDESPARIYIKPDVSGKRYVWVWWHELGHVAEQQEPGAVAPLSPANELWAEWFANCHVPRTKRWMAYRWKHGWPADKRQLRQRCEANGVV